MTSKLLLDAVFLSSSVPSLPPASSEQGEVQNRDKLKKHVPGSDSFNKHLASPHLWRVGLWEQKLKWAPPPPTRGFQSVVCGKQNRAAQIINSNNKALEVIQFNIYWRYVMKETKKLADILHTEFQHPRPIGLKIKMSQFLWIGGGEE